MIKEKQGIAKDFQIFLGLNLPLIRTKPPVPLAENRAQTGTDFFRFGL
jgi:hypothetical protein